jgi:hypothetical protein
LEDIVLYLRCASICIFSSTVRWMYGHESFHELARAMWR